ncbi:HesA/MoeB/ThiF family protein [Lutimaribacter marinistellae]|uniref:HesA/MoeB/ThiF family protein n=1 Tax=Lutimaribacter marinistellae TaxID=1820329 RepID=A0ABV7TF37_9RHOB
MNRYARQMILPEVGQGGQDRLAAARVLVVGAGGLAAPLLPLLAGAGVGAITIMDPDTVELTNLHRQTLFTESDCGRPKAEVAAERCRAINSEGVHHGTNRSITPENVVQNGQKVDLILDCADSYAASYLLSDACLALGKPLITASALGMSGYVAGVCGGAPSLRALFPDAPDGTATCATAGVLGPVVGILGSMQAQMALSVLLGLSPSPLGQLVQFDAATLRSTSFRFDEAHEPQRVFSFVSPSDLTGEDTIIELRDTVEAPVPLHPKAQRLAPADLTKIETNRGKRLALCCATGLRAWRAAEEISTRWPGEIVLVAARTS